MNGSGMVVISVKEYIYLLRLSLHCPREDAMRRSSPEHMKMIEERVRNTQIGTYTKLSRKDFSSHGPGLVSTPAPEIYHGSRGGGTAAPDGLQPDSCAEKTSERRA